MNPQPNQELLTEFYNSTYRNSSYSMLLDGKIIDTPVDFDRSIQGFQRFKNFYDIVLSNELREPNIVPKHGDVILDIGGYQGAFLTAATQVWNCEGVLLDYNKQGVEFAINAFGFERSKIVKDINSESLTERVRFVTAVHSFEHFSDPTAFLAHLKADVLLGDGFFYLEVPNLFGSHLSDPTHFFTYSERSLRYLLEHAGFEIVDLRFSGYPREDLIIGHSKENLVCIARPNDSIRPQSFASVNKLVAYRDLRRTHRALNFSMLLKVAKKWTVSTVYLAACAFYVLIIDTFSLDELKIVQSLVNRIKKSKVFRGILS